MAHSRFQDQNFRLSDIQKEVEVVCPSCSRKALATVDCGPFFKSYID